MKKFIVIFIGGLIIASTVLLFLGNPDVVQKFKERFLGAKVNAFMDEQPKSAQLVLEGGTYLYAGVPVNESYPHKLKPLKRIGYVGEYDDGRGNPAWVAYCITMEKEHEEHKRPSGFKTDPVTEARITHKDYTNSGYDRGHMAPNEAISESYGREAQIETFLMTNVVPQKGDLNRGPWRQLEQDLVDRVMETKVPVYVITGPIYRGAVEMMPNKKVEIPDAFFKIAISGNEGFHWYTAVIMPQAATRKSKPSKYVVTIDEIEQLTGFDFLSELDDATEESVESVLFQR